MRHTEELSTYDALSYWAVNLSSAFLLSAAHNVLYFVLDIRTPVIHFLHNFNTFVFLLFCELVLRSRQKRGYERFEEKDKPTTSTDQWGLIVPPAVLQLICTLLSSLIHSQNRTGSLYLLRLFDFLTAIVALKLAPTFLGVGTRNRPFWSLMLPIAIGASLSWLELTHIEYDGLALLLSPFLSLVQGLHLVVFQNSMRQIRLDGKSFHRFALWYVGFVSALLSIPALISYSMTVVPYDASWESIDYVLMAMSMIFMIVFKYSELLMIAHINLKQYLVLEHSKFFLASCGQWFLQNMAHATVYAACGKAIFVASVLRYWSSLPERRSLNEL